MSQNRNLSGCQVFHSEELPLGWACVPLEKRVELVYGRALREEDRRPGNVDVFGSNGKVGTHNEEWLPGPGVLVGRKGTIGAVRFAPRSFWPIDTVYYLQPKFKDSLRYLFHLFSFLPLPFLNAATGVPGLTRRDVYALRGVFPPSDEQAAITRILDAADAAIERAHQATVQARMLQYSLLHDLLKHGLDGPRSINGKRPAHWQTKSVREVAEVGSGVTLGKDVSGFKSVELPYLRVANVQDGRLDLREIKTVRVRCEEVERFRLEPGDVLMTEGGDLDKLGRGTLWEGQIPECLHQNHVFRIRADRAQLDPRYFAYVVESDIAKAYFMRVAKRTTNLASTNKTQVRAFAFPLPPPVEQEQIANVMDAIKKKRRALVAKEAALVQLKVSLLHDLLTGTARVHPEQLSAIISP